MPSDAASADRVVVATVTWARSPEEEELLKRSLEVLSQHASCVAVADRGARDSFSAALASVPGVVAEVPEQQGLVAQVKASFRISARWQTPFVLYTEPDKESFFRAGLAPFLQRARQHADAGIILASRSRKSFQSFPAMQRRTEGFINEVCSEMTGVAGDYSYGPFLVARALLPCIESAADDLGWGWRFRIFLTAHRQDFRIVHLTDDYFCPPDQQADSAEQRLHRLRQLSQNALGLIDTSLPA